MAGARRWIGLEALEAGYSAACGEILGSRISGYSMYTDSMCVHNSTNRTFGWARS
ncbi:uncharacterized protein PGTG_20722 [Puccinia graminis f. sp. tritici CRL 75-36-700-3]|uniref:Uncharacterized protein n=1 Tax=Puccinia graminis f. sp. tritici (strain CRL 75-36-700-3 / race SCCL) TaxID=418459 RepID=H6QP23_PUCGT|nr:uncharacterized protein PGTG_20722 [Puccinia graminis f. sp. tritici CRL 75-36-700-3]EHS63137.1 hypothetical protein PGTG_20722 [Puccinia graminis f. sp. tritici CRL 75-36-700-3]